MAASTSTATFNYAQNIVPIFTGESYDFWSTQMKTLFISQDLWDLIKEGYEQPEDLSTLAAAKLKEYKQNKQRDARALLFIQQGVSKTIFPRISGATKSKEAWEILKKQFSGYDKVISIKLQNLWREFENLQMKENEIVQEKYLEDLLKRFQMNNCKLVSTPMAFNEKLHSDDGVEKVDARNYQSLVGSLIYLTNTRPNIVQPVNLISRFMNEPSKIHLTTTKRILHYLNGTKKLGIKYVKEKDSKLVGYTDSDWAGSIDDRKSTSGYLFCLGTKPISWSSKK